jgi:dGTP triphosphohydrolase
MNVLNLRAELRKYGKLYKKKYKSQIKKDKTDASGKLYKSISYKTKSTKRYSTLDLLANSYIEQISEGRRVGKTPPSNEILEWAKAKNIKPEKGPDTESNRKRMAFAIARSIGVHGMIERLGFKGTGIIDKVFDSLSKQMETDLFKAYEKDLDEAIKEINDKTK